MMITSILLPCLGLFLLGGSVGYMSGLFGCGGGFMLTPLLIAWFAIPAEIAVGSGLAQMIAAASMATFRHATAKYVDARLTWCMAPGMLTGAYLGKALLSWLHHLGSVSIANRHMPIMGLVLDAFYLCILLTSAYRLWRETPEKVTAGNGHWRWEQGPWLIALPTSGIARCSVLSLCAAGLFLGILAGLLGIGGGVLLIPLLLYGYGLPIRMAIGTSSSLVLISAVFGTVLHAIAGHVSLGIVLALMAGSLISAPLGAKHSHRLQAHALQRAFALLVLIVGVIVLINACSPFLTSGTHKHV